MGEYPAEAAAWFSISPAPWYPPSGRLSSTLLNYRPPLLASTKFFIMFFIFQLRVFNLPSIKQGCLCANIFEQVPVSKAPRYAIQFAKLNLPFLSLYGFR